ncbi:hypothetical protein NEIELOOT_02095 [Neisseria elongata subsp. glycolytica ATCC 29315]|uniref:Uncharacterized protein n=1 Tax=Neisseria elongata subsp. glycolytica ATCC 29315 TaxID=546263 RepID=D4DSQ0_NEIEG|nr:hypothetical protein NEIELOOT_02095 [Neisseria elongata subsp. glycolytica ATCC 29315]
MVCRPISELQNYENDSYNYLLRRRQYRFLFFHFDFKESSDEHPYRTRHHG